MTLKQKHITVWFLLLFSVVANIFLFSDFINRNEKKNYIQYKDPVKIELPKDVNTMSVTLYNDLVSEQFLLDANADHPEHENQIAGTTFIEDDECYIFARTPEDANDRELMATLGHELLHCYVGQYHSQ